MTKEEIMGAVGTRDGVAVFGGRRYYLVDRRGFRHPQTGERMVNAVAEDAWELSPGYLAMTLLVLPRRWKRGGEARDALPNGEYDWIMQEQRGLVTPPCGRGGARCHDL